MNSDRPVPVIQLLAVDFNRPTAARIYDYLLGGSANFAADRQAAERIEAAVPGARQAARDNRGFLHRTVRYLVSEGIDQFVDCGSGIPTVGNVHEIAQAANPHAHMAYVDVDPVAVAHSKALLKNNPGADIVLADVRDPQTYLTHPDLVRLVDFTRPVAVLMLAVLHFLTDQDDPWHVVAGIRRHLPPGSFLAISHGSNADRAEDAAQIAELYQQTANPITPRDRDKVVRLFEGLEMVEPGIVWVEDWRPETRLRTAGVAGQHAVLAGVGQLLAGRHTGAE